MSSYSKPTLNPHRTAVTTTMPVADNVQWLYSIPTLNPHSTAVPTTMSVSDDVQWNLLKRWQSFPSGHPCWPGRW